jgi:hypothetical protein
MTVDKVKFAFEFGRFIGEVKSALSSGDDFDVDDFALIASKYFESIEDKSVNKDNAINFLSQAVQLYDGFLSGIYPQLDEELQDQFDKVRKDVNDVLYPAVIKELNWVTLTKGN